jgi:transcriptional regulator of acetoin/glycerol metabolism
MSQWPRLRNQGLVPQHLARHGTPFPHALFGEVQLSNLTGNIGAGYTGTLPRLYIPEEGTSLEEVERAMVELAMRQANGNQTHAARLLDISRDALRYKLKKFELVPDDEASDSVPSENSSS